MKLCGTSQCGECPFRSTSLPGYLGGYQEPSVVFSGLWKQEPFFCHTRTDYDDPRWKEKAMAHGKLCVGALIMMGREIAKGAFPEREDPEVAKAIKVAMAIAEAYPETTDVMGPREFMAHHTLQRTGKEE